MVKTAPDTMRSSVVQRTMSESGAQTGATVVFAAAIETVLGDDVWPLQLTLERVGVYNITMTSTLGSRSHAAKGRVLSPAFLERQWKPGQSGNPSGHAAEYGEVVRLARQLSVRAMKRLGELIESADERVAAVAANSVLDRAYGKSEVRRPEPIDDVVARLERMTDAERLEDAKRLAAQIREALDRDRRKRTIEGDASEIED